MVIWIIGLSASGKTTLGKLMHDYLEAASGDKWILLDGDVFRNIFGDVGHSVDERRDNGKRISRFCQFLDFNNINVIACVLSIFHEHQNYNREKIKNYREIFIDVSLENLIKRDNKNLYQKALDGDLKNVVGVDIDFSPPLNYDYKIDNKIDNLDFIYEINKIIKEFKIPINSQYKYSSKNILISPNKYEYSNFEGDMFFEKYFASRNSFLDVLVTRRDESITITEEYSKESNDYTRENELITNLFLKNLLSKNYQTIKIYLDKIKTLIKRFEVSKKLFHSYDKISIKKTSTIYNEVDNYSLFSILLQTCYINSEVKEEKLIYLNCILKLNDLIISIKDNIILQSSIDLCIKAISGEIELTSKFYDSIFNAFSK